MSRTKEITYTIELTRLELAILKDIITFAEDSDYAGFSDLGKEYDTDVDAYESLKQTIKLTEPTIHWATRYDKD